MIEILAPGPLATVQDRGRIGYAHLGIGRSGAADRGALGKANRRVGNDEVAAAIEITLGQFHARFANAATIVLTGARAPATLGGREVDYGMPITAPAGAELAIGIPERGLRTYLGVRGGIDVAPVLGSRATDTLGHIGPPPLAAGDVLPVGADPGTDVVDAPFVPRRHSDVFCVIPGPRVDWFRTGALTALISENWTVEADSNRVGVRLSGPTLQRLRRTELPSEPTLPGAIQVPPNGQPIILGPDAPVTGGYPVIAVVDSEDLDRVFQVRPGDRVLFHA